MMRGTKFTSKFSKEVSTIDYFVQFKNEEVGSIIFFFVSDPEVYVFVEIYAKKETEGHLTLIETTNKKAVFNVEAIQSKLIYMYITKKEIVTKIPNKYEKT